MTTLNPGRKDDGGKLGWSLLMRGCGLSLHAVVEVLAFGAKKYSADSWQRVEDGYTRYRDAMYRHLHQIELRGIAARDPETGLLEWAHVACNALFLLYFAIQHDTSVQQAPASDDRDAPATGGKAESARRPYGY